MISTEKATQTIVKNVKRLSSESRPLNKALGYVLAADLIPAINVPLFDNSAMDGFAIHKSDLQSKQIICVINEVRAGQVVKQVVRKGAAVSIMTGSPIPKGTAAVIPIENTTYTPSPLVGDLPASLKSSQRRQAGGRGEGKNFLLSFKILKPVMKGANIRSKGEDIKKGSVLIKKGTVLKPIHIGLAASIGQAKLKVFRKPKVALIVSGDEIKKPGRKLKKGQIYDSNSFLLTSLLRSLGIDFILKRRAYDNLNQMVKVLKEALKKTDIILTTGGISVGKYDLAKPALEEIGAVCHFNKVKQKPGKPLSFFTYKNKAVVSLPGNPVAVAVCFELYVRPALLKLGGYSSLYRKDVQARLGANLKKKRGRKTWLRVSLTQKNGTLIAKPTGVQGSGVLTSMLADGIALLEEEKQEFKVGEAIKVIDFEGAYK